MREMTASGNKSWSALSVKSSKVRPRSTLPCYSLSLVYKSSASDSASIDVLLVCCSSRVLYSVSNTSELFSRAVSCLTSYSSDAIY